MSDNQLKIEVGAEADHVVIGMTSGSMAVQVVVSRETAAALAEVLARVASGQEAGDEK